MFGFCCCLILITASFSRNHSMEWSESHDLALCGEVLLLEPFKYPKRSKERGEIWGRIALNLNSVNSPKFKVSKRSVRDRFTMLQTKYKEEITEEERASGMDCEETQLDAALEEITEKERAANPERNDKAGVMNKKIETEKASAEEVRKQAMERLGKTQKRNADSEEGKSSKYRKRSSDAVEYLKEKFQEEKELRKEEIELKRNEQQMMLDQQSQMQKQQLEMMKMMQKQNEALMALLAKAL